MDWQIQKRTPKLHDVRLLEKQSIVRSQKHQLPSKIGDVVRKPESSTDAITLKTLDDLRHQVQVDVYDHLAGVVQRSPDNTPLGERIEPWESLTRQCCAASDQSLFMNPPCRPEQSHRMTEAAQPVSHVLSELFGIDRTNHAYLHQYLSRN
jgi:hypothetical protein